MTLPQSSLTDRIQTLDDVTARRLLTTFARAQTPPVATQVTPALAQALRELAPEPVTGPVTEGDAARAALLLLAQDPQQRPLLTALLDGPAPERFGVLETTALVSALLIVLQIHVRFERHKDGSYSFKIEKKPTDATVLKVVVQKLLTLMKLDL